MPKFGSQIDAMKVPIKNIVVETSATAPASPVNGQFWYDTSTNKLKIYANSAWLALDGSTTATLDAIPAPVASVSLNSQKITNLATPTAATDAANKQYVDDKVQGLSAKDSVQAATTANITLSGTQTIDGVTLSVGDRVLVKDQTTASQNGIYIVLSGSWTRASDFDTSAEVEKGAYVFVEGGTQNSDSGWVLSTDGTITIGSTSLSFTKFSGAGQITAGNGLTKTGNTLDVGAGTGITVAADTVGITPGGVSATELADNAVSLSGTKVTGTLAVAKGGTGGTTQLGARTGINAAGYLRVTLPALSAGTAANVTAAASNFSTANPTVIFTQGTDQIFLDYTYDNTTDTLSVTAAVALASGIIATMVG
jgi:hypothetical protein